MIGAVKRMSSTSSWNRNGTGVVARISYAFGSVERRSLATATPSASIESPPVASLASAWRNWKSGGLAQLGRSVCRSRPAAVYAELLGSGRDSTSKIVPKLVGRA